MTVSQSTRRLDYGHQVEAQFRDWLDNQIGWSACEFGQDLLPEALSNDMRLIQLPLSDPIAQELIQLLPENWRHIYKRGVGQTMKSLCRWDADVLCKHYKRPVFFAEVKSSMTRTPNVSIEISCYLAAVVNRLRLGLPQYFVFSPQEPDGDWTYLTVEQIVEHACRVLDGNSTNGSGTPFLLIPKTVLTQKVSTLLFAQELI